MRALPTRRPTWGRFFCAARSCRAIYRVAGTDRQGRGEQAARGQFTLATAMTAGQMRPQVIVAASSYNASTSSRYVEARRMLVERRGRASRGPCWRSGK